MQSDREREQALELLLAAAYGGTDRNKVDLQTILAALTPDERAQFNNPVVPSRNPASTLHAPTNESDADSAKS
jgi:hypothetical protein